MNFGATGLPVYYSVRWTFPNSFSTSYHAFARGQYNTDNTRLYGYNWITTESNLTSMMVRTEQSEPIVSIFAIGY